MPDPIQAFRATHLLGDGGRSLVEGGGDGRGLTGGLALGKVVGLDSRHETDAGPGDGEAAEHETDEGNQESATHLAQPNL